MVITLENEKGEDIKIRTKTIDVARKNLGHWKEPEEIKSPEQFPVSLQTAIDTSDAIFTAGVTKKEAAMLYHGVYRPKVEYPLVQTFLTDKQVKKIESASLPKIIAKCGYNRNIYKRRPERIWRGRIHCISQYNWSNMSSTFSKELEDTK